jgi:uncharacterized membrane protein
MSTSTSISGSTTAPRIARRPAGAPSPATGRRPWFLGDLAALAALAASVGLAWVHSLWLVNGIELVLLLWLPGVLLLRALGIRPDLVRANPVYGAAASLAVLIATALLINSVGPGWGIAHPLERLPLACGLAAICLVLIAVARVRSGPDFLLYLPRIDRVRAVTCLLPAIPALAALGALWLTNSHGSEAAIAAVALSGATLLVGGVTADRLDAGRCRAILYFVSVALMFSFSLRGRFVYGSDILAEYHDYVSVLGAHRWAIHPHNPAYYSMMSLTTLPTMLSVLSGAAPLFVFKFVYPALLGFFPVGIFAIGARFLSHRSAFVAAMLLSVQSYLFAEMPAIARQIIALLFMVALLGELSDVDLKPGQRRLAIAIFALGMVVSHYGTTYFMILMLGVALVVGLAMRLIKRGAGLPLWDLVIGVAVLAIGAFVWYVPVTHSTANVSAVFTALRSQGFSLLPGGKSHSGIGSYISGNVPSAVNPNRLQHLVAAQYRLHDQFIHPLKAAGDPRWRLHPVADQTPAVRAPHVFHAVTLLNTIVTQLINLLGVVTCVWLAFRRTENPRLRTLALIGIGTLGGLVVIRVSGTIANQYNQERAFLQAFAPLSICIGWLLDWCRRRLRPLAMLVWLAPLALTVTFFVTSGLSARVFGGNLTANLSNRGAESDQFIVTVPEITGARWVDKAAGKALLYTDRYGQLRITAATGRVGGMFINIMPKALDKYGWIYADERNVRSGVVSAQLNSTTSMYQWPGYVPHYWNRVYSNGYSAGYARR